MNNFCFLGLVILLLNSSAVLAQKGGQKFNRKNVKMVDGNCSVNGKVGPYKNSPCALLYPQTGSTAQPTPIIEPTIKVTPKSQSVN